MVNVADELYHSAFEEVSEVDIWSCDLFVLEEGMHKLECECAVRLFVCGGVIGEKDVL